MKFEKDFNPGTGNSYIIVESGGNYYNCPNATTLSPVTHNHFAGTAPQQPTTQPQPATQKPSLTDEQKQQIKDEIIEYTARIEQYVADRWKPQYRQLWLQILSLPEAEAQIYETGKQQNTNFNRNLVGNIIHMLKPKVIKPGTYDTELAKALESNPKSSIRHQMPYPPQPQTLADKIKQIINQTEEEWTNPKP